MPSRPTALIALLAIFLLLIVGITYSQHPDEGWNEIGIKFSFFIFPMLALLLPKVNREEVTSVHHAFVAGCFLFMTITLAHGIFITLNHGDWYYLTYDRLSWYMHPTYAATYQSISLFILMNEWIKTHAWSFRKWLLSCSILIALVFIALLSSKAGYLCALLVIVFAVFRALAVGLGVSRIISATTIAAAVFILTIVALPTTSARVEHAVNDIRTGETEDLHTESSGDHTSSTQVRLVTWGGAWTILRQNPFGAGTGDTQPILNSLYEQQSEHYAAKREFNAHNQFLQTGAEIGWFGLAALFLALGSLWVVGQNEPTARLFVLLCALNFLFESFLEVQAGIVFFSFWVLVYSKLSK